MGKKLKKFGKWVQAALEAFPMNPRKQLVAVRVSVPAYHRYSRRK